MPPPTLNSEEPIKLTKAMTRLLLLPQNGVFPSMN